MKTLSYKFTGITPDKFASIEADAQAGIGITITGDHGTATARKVTLTWSYDCAAQELVIECLDKPWYASDQMVSDRINKLVNAS